jgi:hypothetical protein
MKSSKTSANQARRNARRQFCKLTYRCFGIECLEKRTVFASDLFSMLDEVGVCFASPVEESRTATSIDRTVEIATSDLSLIQGDFIRFEVPESILLQLTDRDSYQLQVFYSENYFLYEPNTRAAPSNGANDGQTSQPSSDQRAQYGSLLAEQPLSNGNIFDTAVGNSGQMVRQDSVVGLASLMASRDFEGTIRLFDLVHESSLRSTDATIAGLPNEVRIEPRVTVPTAMRDPGATLVKTIVVNRAASGLVVSEDNSRIESTVKEGAATAEKPETTSTATTTTTSDSSDQKPRRTVVTLKTVDISMARRTETSRPWIRSMTIPNPFDRRESEWKRTDSESVPIASTSSVKLRAESNKPMRRELRVPGTQLQPVDFLLAKSTDDTLEGEQVTPERILAIDRAISEYSDSQSLETLHNWDDTGWFDRNFLEFDQPTSIPHLTDSEQVLVRGLIGNTMQLQLSNLYFLSIHNGIASNKESWKNAVRSASESTAGQAMLAGLTTVAVQHRDINAFGTKSAWEFVTKTAQSSPV